MYKHFIYILIILSYIDTKQFKIMKWERAEQGEIKGSLVDYIEGLIEREIEKGNIIKVCVGTDSQKKGFGYKYVTAIILEIKQPMGKDKYGREQVIGRGAMIIIGSTYEKGIPTINERMIKEVQSTVVTAYDLYPLLDLYGVKLELHADINQNPMHGSNIALKSAIGYMSGIPCDIKVKPDAYASSSAADKFCK